MQDTIQVEDVNSVQRKISIQVSADSVDRKFTEFFEGIKKDVQIPGFRKGKAPVGRIKQHFGHKARPSIAQIIISEYYTQAVREHDLNPVGNPTIKDFTPGEDEYPGEFSFDNSYTVELVVEILPKIDPVGYEDLALEFPESNLQEEIDNKLQAYREQFAEHNQILDRGAQEGDSLILDFVGKLDGEVEPFAGGSAEGFSIKSLGEGTLIPGFEEQLVGMQIGDEKIINVTFPETYSASHLASKDARFDVKLHSIVETKLAEVDEDLAMMVGYDSVGELENHVKQEAERGVQLQERNALEVQITNKLLELNDFDVPESMVNFEAQRLINQAQKRGQKLPPNVVEMIKPAAKKNVMRAILIDAIYNKEAGVEVTPAELDDMLEEHASRNNTTKDELVSMLYRSNQMDAFVGVLRSRKVIDYIIDIAKSKVKE